MSLQAVLRTRLLPPRLPPDVVARPELVAAVERGLDGRVCAIVAGAGYGKTTLMAMARERSPMVWVWCSCDARIPDRRALLAHLAAGIAERYPGFGAGLLLDGSADEQVTALANELLQTVGEELVLALDDVHLLPESAASVLAVLVEALPPNVHLLLAARAPLPLPMARLRAARTVELGEADLSLSVPEAASLVRALGADLDPDELGDLHRRTEGWAAGIVLAARPDAPGVGRALEPTEFAYLAEEVLERQDPARQDFLLETSVLGRFTPELAAAVTGRPDALEEITALIVDHLFVIPLDEEGRWFRYHHLFQAFLRERLARRDPSRPARLNAAAADWWLSEGQPTEAVTHLLAAGEEERALELIDDVAEEMALSPQAATLADWLARIPRERWAARPRLLLARASLLLAEARYEDSFAQIEEAVDVLIAAGEHERAATALLRLQQTMLTAGASPSRRAAAAERYVDRIDRGTPLFPMVLILLASAYGYGCRFEEARAALDEAVGLPASRALPVMETYADLARAFYVDFWVGDPHEALALMGRARAVLARDPDRDVLALAPFATVLYTYLILELGRFEETERWVTVTRGLFARRGMPEALERSAHWVELSLAAGLGRLDDLDRLLAEARPPGLGTSYAYRYRGPAARLAGRRGDRAAVREHVALARREMAGFGVAFDDATVLCDLALGAHDAGEEDLAAAQARDAVAAAAAVPSPWLSARAALVAAHVLGPQEHVSHLERALELTGEWGFEDLWSGRERLIAPAVLGRAITRDVEPALVDRLLAGCGVEATRDVLDAAADAPAVRARAAAVLADCADTDLDLIDRLLRDPDKSVREAARRSWTRLKARPRAAMRLETLGGLRILRDGVEVPPRAFSRQKARALLAALICAGGPVHREVLCEWLWPDLPPERAAAALRTTLHDLRRAIEPELEAASPSSLFATDGDTVALVLGDQDGLDVRELEELMRPGGGDEIERLLAAEALCRGEFLPDWRYEGWTSARRAEVESRITELDERLAEALLTADRPADAVARYRRLLEREPERESWHRALMRAHAAAGERALALRQFHACRTLLRAEQGIEPDPETRALFDTLLREESAAEASSVTPA